ncbi:hypothetical protein [Crenobacter intestini]|uniref:Uncharacterized protein n=1 Tax=Crenobacter intestini TaxID=2563443 RepID=A0A4T0UK10_9NEIS|nr:hypothetical protein [Crenobacter intestini]TIC78485.1 hypothetical protein E5K04_16030 [Crenobacter intestini]
MRIFQRIQREVTVLTQCRCDRCGLPLAGEGADVFEAQEALHVDFVGGYGSVFGDGDRVCGDFCQACVQAVLGEWLRVSAPEDGGPKLAQNATQRSKPDAPE